MRKSNEHNKIIRYKMCVLVVQGLLQRRGIDYDNMYSLVIDTITF